MADHSNDNGGSMSKKEEEQQRNQQLAQLQAQMAELGVVQALPASSEAAADDSQTKHAFWDTQVRHSMYIMSLLYASRLYSIDVSFTHFQTSMCKSMFQLDPIISYLLHI
jgi:hypothetical protein